VGVEDPVGMEDIVEEGGLVDLVSPVHMVDTLEVEDPVGKVETVPMAGIVEVEGRVAMEGIMAGVEDIGGIMAGMADIMVDMVGSFPDYLSAVS
jgi:hypothetical protein